MYVRQGVETLTLNFASTSFVVENGRVTKYISYPCQNLKIVLIEREIQLLRTAYNIAHKNTWFLFRNLYPRILALQWFAYFLKLHHYTSSEHDKDCHQHESVSFIWGEAVVRWSRSHFALK